MNTNNNAKEVLRGLIEIYENDFLSGYNQKDFEQLRVLFLDLIVQVTRYVNEYNYCSSPDCPCSPKSRIKGIVLKNEDAIFGKLLGNDYPLTDVPIDKIRNFLTDFVTN